MKGSLTKIGYKLLLLFLFVTWATAAFGAAKVNIISGSKTEVVIEITGARCGPAWPGCPTDIARIMPIAQGHCDKYAREAHFQGKADFQQPVYRVSCVAPDEAAAALQRFESNYGPLETEMTREAWAGLRYVISKFGVEKSEIYLLMLRGGVELVAPARGSEIRFGLLLSGGEKVADNDNISVSLQAPDRLGRVANYAKLVSEVANRDPSRSFTDAEVLEIVESTERGDPGGFNSYRGP